MKNPLEEVFDIEENSTPNMFPVLSDENLPTEVINPKTGEIMELSPDDSFEDQERAERVEDLQLQGQFETIYKQALGAFEQQLELSQTVDPKFSARNAEVAAQMLSIALNSTKDRVDAKYKRQKVKIAKGQIGIPNTVNNNLVVADRNDLLKILKDTKSDSIIESK